MEGEQGEQGETLNRGGDRIADERVGEANSRRGGAVFREFKGNSGRRGRELEHSKFNPT